MGQRNHAKQRDADLKPFRPSKPAFLALRRKARQGTEARRLLRRHRMRAWTECYSLTRPLRTFAA
jgi:hypothetical protein